MYVGLGIFSIALNQILVLTTITARTALMVHIAQIAPTVLLVVIVPIALIVLLVVIALSTINSTSVRGP